MDRDRLPHLTVKYQPSGKRSQKLLDSCWYRKSSRGPNPCKLYDYDEADDHVRVCELYAVCMYVVLRLLWGGGGLLLLVRLEFYTYEFSVSLCSKYNLNRI